MEKVGLTSHICNDNYDEDCAIGRLQPERRLLSIVRAFPPLRVVLCRLLTSARRSGRIPPPSVLARTPRRSPVVSWHTFRA
jgi:hypothetical protein